MTELAEMAYVAIIKDDDGPCPFCESKEEKKELKLEVENDSRKLADAGITGMGKVGHSINVPLLSKDGSRLLYIVDGYFVRLDCSTNIIESKIAQNAHHIIPGNASFANAKGLHKWLAAEVAIKKVRYSKDETGTPGNVETKVDGKVTTVCKLVHITEAGSGRKETVKTTAEKHVYGIVNYDINGPFNGVWLPSSNAISGWSKLPDKWKKNYAHAAMKKHGYQFHDAHKEYSKSVSDELDKIEQKIRARNQACISACEEPDKKPVPAPKKLNAVLNKLSQLICEKKLKLKPGVKVKEEWATSPHAVGYKLPKT